MQNIASIRKAERRDAGTSASRRPEDLLRDLISTHMENAAAGACSSYMRYLLQQKHSLTSGMLARRTISFLKTAPRNDPFRTITSLLLRRNVNPVEDSLAETLGTIQIHHGSAGSNMVARYLASLHTRSVSDLFTAGQMALECARHFGTIVELTEFMAQLEWVTSNRRDLLIRQRAIAGNLPAFGHPEIAAAGRDNHMEVDPRSAIYLAPLFEAIDAGKLPLSSVQLKRIEIVQRMYQLAFVEGIAKPGRKGRLRIAPNTDFGAWIVQEALEIDEQDRTLLSYVFRGFGWMMDVREQLQQPIIRPVIPPDPAIVREPAAEGAIARLVEAVHLRLSKPSAFVAASAA
jgi:citrate synthase